MIPWLPHIAENKKIGRPKRQDTDGHNSFPMQFKRCV